MNEGGIRRRLAAVLAADVVGYTRLMEADTDGTVAAWQLARADVIDPTVPDHGGRLVKLTGDGFLAEFNSVQDAVVCAIAMQEKLAESSLEFRMGVNLGDVVDDGDDIHGEGVNIAARIEALADAGGICISGGVYDQVRNRLAHQFRDMGEHAVKNVSAPIRVFSVVSSHMDEPPEVDQISRLLDQPLSLPDKPSIAVLPFDNMSGNAEQEYFADGISEDIITEISRYSGFFVIARNSSFAYKGQSIDIKQIGRELGARYVLEGSVRRAGNRVRITAQLIEAGTGNHVWAERYDRELDDIFSVQDEITERIVFAVAPEIHASETTRAGRMQIQDLGVWELVSRAYWHIWKLTKRDNFEACSLLSEAREQGVENAALVTALAVCYCFDGVYFWQRPAPESYAKCAELAREAIDLDANDEVAHWILGLALTGLKQHSEAIRRLETAIEINPNFSRAYGNLGLTKILAHEFDGAIDLLEKAIRLSPKDPLVCYYTGIIGSYHFLEERYEEALVWADKTLHVNPKHNLIHGLELAAHGMLGNHDEAAKALEMVKRNFPNATIKSMKQNSLFASQTDIQRYAEGWQRGGLAKE